MKDKEIFDLVRILNNSNIEKINFEFQDAYCDYVSCTIERRYHEHLPVQRASGSSDDALKFALELLEEVKPWDDKLRMPDVSHQQFQGGYYREMLDEEYEVEFKRYGLKFVITDIRRKDKDNFYYSKIPYPVSKDDTFVRKLPDDTELWTWNNISYLSGTAGQMIVKDGMVIKSKMTAIS